VFVFAWRWCVVVGHGEALAMCLNVMMVSGLSGGGRGGEEKAVVNTVVALTSPLSNIGGHVIFCLCLPLYFLPIFTCERYTERYDRHPHPPHC